MRNSPAARHCLPFIPASVSRRSHEWEPAPEATTNGHAALAPYNSAILIDSQGQKVFSYDKVHLVPFGEYEPFPLIHRVAASFSDEIGGFRKGRKYSVGPLPGGYSFGTFICYEAIFPNEVRHFAAAGADLLVNISNDGVVRPLRRTGTTSAHGSRPRGRNRRWLLRVTNNGFTVSVDPTAAFSVRFPPTSAPLSICPTTFAPTKPFTRGSTIGSLGCASSFPLFC